MTRPTFIALILAGDGNVDQCIGPYYTHAEASTLGQRLLERYYDPTYDRLLVESFQSYRAAVTECEEAEEENKRYEEGS